MGDSDIFSNSFLGRYRSRVEVVVTVRPFRTRLGKRSIVGEMSRLGPARRLLGSGRTRSDLPALPDANVSVTVSPRLLAGPTLGLLEPDTVPLALAAFFWASSSALISSKVLPITEESSSSCER
jgi:hypothetical protein